ncbi:uncharacterized protein LOC112494844 [Cephus cinctus]|uniref:Uncharacterized protein LOC112494844 n=1 Tax=Cephus cinctus TaxID=211228 RepID=A0AAJ7RN97_CEPCN|nr:uncharacterized protein LOC112494844 [Cephus cinctus]
MQCLIGNIPSVCTQLSSRWMRKEIKARYCTVYLLWEKHLLLPGKNKGHRRSSCEHLSRSQVNSLLAEGSSSTVRALDLLIWLIFPRVPTFSGPLSGVRDADDDTLEEKYFELRKFVRLYRDKNLLMVLYRSERAIGTRLSGWGSVRMRSGSLGVLSEINIFTFIDRIYMKI